ncbi:MAG: hypothetical protein NT069_34355, partial [Planctomycetota bacterium]|nr:hypothetical protein [Planctomycetota bacterium]
MLGIDAHDKQVTLTAANEVTEEGAIVARSLSLNGTGPWKLDTHQNNVISLSANVQGNLLYRDADGFEVAGITAAGHDVTLNATQEVTESAAIQARQLTLIGAGPWTLDTQKNDVEKLFASVEGDLAYQDANGFIVLGITANDKQVTLTAANEVTEEGAIVARSLSLNGAGPWKLDTQSNNVANLSANIQGNLLYRDADGFEVAGIQAQNYDVTLIAPQEVTQEATPSGAIQTRTLSLKGAGPWILDNPNNLVASLTADIQGNLFFQNADQLVLNRLSAPGHTATLVAGGTVSQNHAITVKELNVTVMNDSAPPLAKDITLTHPDNDTGTVSLQIVRSDLSRGNGTVAYVGKNGVKIARIVTSGTAIFTSSPGQSPDGLVEQTETGAIDADSLKVEGSGKFQLNSKNSVGTFAANVTGSLSFHNVGDLQIGTVDGTDGITTTFLTARSTSPTAKSSDTTTKTTEAPGDLNLSIDGNLNVLKDITAGGRLVISATGTTNLENKLPNQSSVTGVKLTAGASKHTGITPVTLLGLRPFLTASPIQVSQDIDVSPDGTTNVTLVVGRETEVGLNVEIQWGDGTTETLSQSAKDFVAGVSFTRLHTYSLESILNQLGGAKPGDLGGSNLFEVQRRAFVATDGNDSPISFTAQTVSPTGEFATEVPPNQAGQITQVFLVTPDTNGNFQLTTNELVVFVANPGIGLAGTELSQFGSRDFILPVRPETPQTQQPPTTVLANAAAN